MNLIEAGHPVPQLTAQSTQGPFDTGQWAGHPYVLYFYPRDNTPGCTTEAQDFRDLHAQFQALRCPVFGVSRDSLKSHERFAEQQALPFALISDPDEVLCQAFGVMKDKNMYGKQVRGIERSTFLIGADGKVVRAWRGVRVPNHAAEVLQAVQTLVDH